MLVVNDQGIYFKLYKSKCRHPKLEWNSQDEATPLSNKNNKSIARLNCLLIKILTCAVVTELATTGRISFLFQVK